MTDVGNQRNLAAGHARHPGVTGVHHVREQAVGGHFVAVFDAGQFRVIEGHGLHDNVLAGDERFVAGHVDFLAAFAGVVHDFREMNAVLQIQRLTRFGTAERIGNVVQHDDVLVIVQLGHAMVLARQDRDGRHGPAGLALDDQLHAQLCLIGQRFGARQRLSHVDGHGQTLGVFDGNAGRLQHHASLQRCVAAVPADDIITSIIMIHFTDQTVSVLLCKAGGIARVTALEALVIGLAVPHIQHPRRIGLVADDIVAARAHGFINGAEGQHLAQQAGIGVQSVARIFYIVNIFRAIGIPRSCIVLIAKETEISAPLL